MIIAQLGIFFHVRYVCVHADVSVTFKNKYVHMFEVCDVETSTHIVDILDSKKHLRVNGGKICSKLYLANLDLSNTPISLKMSKFGHV